MRTVFPAERIRRAILWLRGPKIILDRDLAVNVSSLNQEPEQGSIEEPREVSRLFYASAHTIRIPRLEVSIWKIKLWRDTEVAEAFTEQGIAMLSSVPRSTPATRTTQG